MSKYNQVAVKRLENENDNNVKRVVEGFTFLYNIIRL